jgi:hypothetical protein
MTRSPSELDACAVPPFVRGIGRGADRLSPEQVAENVRTAWQRAGHAIVVWIETQSMPDGTKVPVSVVRSDLISGLPRAVWCNHYAAYLKAGGTPVRQPKDTVDA